MGAVLVYDISKQESFQSLERWRAEVENFAPRGCKIVLVGNKIDLQFARSVSKADADAFASANGMRHIETRDQFNYRIPNLTYEIEVLFQMIPI